MKEYLEEIQVVKSATADEISAIKASFPEEEEKTAFQDMMRRENLLEMEKAAHNIIEMGDEADHLSTKLGKSKSQMRRANKAKDKLLKDFEEAGLKAEKEGEKIDRNVLFAKYYENYAPEIPSKTSQKIEYDSNEKRIRTNKRDQNGKRIRTRRNKSKQFWNNLQNLI